jgi:hypothetical protein
MNGTYNTHIHKGTYSGPRNRPFGALLLLNFLGRSGQVSNVPEPEAFVPTARTNLHR